MSATDAVTIGATAVDLAQRVRSIASDGHTRRTVRRHRQYLVSFRGVVGSCQTSTFSFLPQGIQMDHYPLARSEGMKAFPGQGRAAAFIAATHTDVIGDGHRCGRVWRPSATVAHPDARRDPADASHTKHFTSTDTYSTDTEEMT